MYISRGFVCIEQAKLMIVLVVTVIEHMPGAPLSIASSSRVSITSWLINVSQAIRKITTELSTIERQLLMMHGGIGGHCFIEIVADQSFSAHSPKYINNLGVGAASTSNHCSIVDFHGSTDLGALDEP
jgi:hypothetical protein